MTEKKMDEVEELVKILSDVASDNGFNYSTYGIKALAEYVIKAGYSRHQQQPSEPLKELDKSTKDKYGDLWLIIYDIVWSETNKNCDLAVSIANRLEKAICSKFGQPSEKKALSVSEIEKILKLEILVKSCEWAEMIGETIPKAAQAIHCAMPSQKEVKWPEKMSRLHKGLCRCEKCIISVYVNDTLDACKKAYEDAIPEQQPLEFLKDEYAKEFRKAYQGILSKEQIEESIRWNIEFVLKHVRSAQQPEDEVYEALNDMYQQFGGMLLGLHPNDRRTKAINKAKAILAHKGNKDGEKGG